MNDDDWRDGTSAGRGPGEAALGAARTGGRTPALALAAAVLLIVSAVVLGVIVRGAASAGDLGLLEVLVRTSPHWIGRLGDLIGNVFVVGGIGLLAALVTYRAGMAGWTATFLVGLAVEVPTELLKYGIDRLRPPTATEVSALGSIASYPSGHTARIVVLAGLIAAAVVWRRGRGGSFAVAVATAVAAFVGFARISAGAHWPTDVLGGILLGGGWIVVALLVGAWVRERARLRAPARVPGRPASRERAAAVEPPD